MRKDFTPETLHEVLGNVHVDGFDQPLHRRALHVDFSARSNQVASQEIFDPFLDDELFNAVGSSVSVRSSNQVGHLPVLDADGGAFVQTLRSGSKLVLNASAKGTYRPASRLRDVLGDNDIDLEVFQGPVLEHHSMIGKELSEDDVVRSIVLRAKKPNAFIAIRSTQSGHSHVYIQQLFSPSDHETLLDELTGVGIITPSWRAMTKAEGQGVIRTPWTRRAVEHLPS